MKKVLFALPLLCLSINAKVLDTKIIDNGGNGPYKAFAVQEEEMPGFTIYRPMDMKTAVKAEGKLPIIVFGNGACANSSLEHEHYLNQVASMGYVVIGIGPFDKGKYGEPQTHPQGGTSPDQLIEAMDWICAQSKAKKGDYYKKVDIDKICAMGMSCGGAQAIYASADPRVKTSVIMNSGMGKLSMAKATPESVFNIHGPILYVIGGPTDIAYDNANIDYEKYTTLPVAQVNFPVGHSGTYLKEFGGEFSPMAIAWLDYQLKGKTELGEKIFKNKDLSDFPAEWTIKSKNF